MFIIALFIIAKTQKQPKCPTIDKWRNKMRGRQVATLLEGWMDGWMEGWMDRWMDGQIDRQME